MLGIIIQLQMSWLIIWWFEKGNLSFLGLFPAKKRVFQFLLFFVITAACCSIDFFLKMLIAKQSWVLNPQLHWKQLLSAFWWNIKSVLFEELLFRGVVLYILIKKIGTSKAILITSIAFGIYHWFSQELWGNPVAMIYIFIITGLMGVLLAYAYSKTKSLYIPIAIHLGWNTMKSVVFSEGPIGNQLYVEVMPRPIITISIFSYIVMLLLGLIVMFCINFFLIKKMKSHFN